MVGWLISAVITIFLVGAARSLRDPRIRALLQYHLELEEWYVSTHNLSPALYVITFLQLLGSTHHDVFALYAGDNLHLFEVTPQEMSSPLQNIRLLHVLKCSVTFELNSGIQWTSNASQMVFLDKGLLRGIHIPHDKLLPPVLVELGRYKNPAVWLSLEFGALGISTSLLPTGSGSLMEVVTHHWSGSGRKGDLVRKAAPVDMPEWADFSIPIMWNEDILRMLLLVSSNDNSRNEPWVLDLCSFIVL